MSPEEPFRPDRLLVLLDVEIIRVREEIAKLEELRYWYLMRGTR